MLVRKVDIVPHQVRAFAAWPGTAHTFHLEGRLVKFDFIFASILLDGELLILLLLILVHCREQWQSQRSPDEADPHGSGR